MVARGDIVWADVGGPAGRRPVCVLTRDDAIDLLNGVTCAPITRTIRDIPTEVVVGVPEGLASPSAISCDNIVTLPKGRLDAEPVGSIDLAARVALDAAIRYALDIRF